MKLLVIFLCICSVWGGSVHRTEPEVYEQWRHEVNTDQLQTGEMLPDDDIILFTENDGSDNEDPDGNPCDRVLPEDQIGVRLSTGEFVSKWKAVALHKRGDPNVYRMLTEIEENQNSMTIIFDAFDLEFNFDLCLWKEASGVLPPYGVYNAYKVSDAPERLQGGRIYTFVWARDSNSQQMEEK